VRPAEGGETRAELAALRRDRDAKQQRVQECINVLLGLDTPSLFDHPPPVEPAPDADPLAMAREMKLATITGIPGSALGKLHRHGEIVTVGQLWDWVDEDGANDGGMADVNGTGLWGCLRQIGVGERPATEFSDAVYCFLKNSGCDPRPDKPTHAARVNLPDVTPGPVVCAPVGSAKLADVPNFPPTAASTLASFGVDTLTALDRRTDECKKQHREITPHNLLRTVQAEFGFELPFADLMAAGDALSDHLVVKTIPAPAPKGKRKGKVKA
jgi:hypothetical protein